MRFSSKGKQVLPIFFKPIVRSIGPHHHTALSDPTGETAKPAHHPTAYFQHTLPGSSAQAGVTYLIK
jgi:hypothetical protein